MSFCSNGQSSVAAAAYRTTSNCIQIKNFISTYYDYANRKNDQVMSNVQRQLQVLSAVEDVSIFEPKHMETLEFYTCLESLLQSESRVAWKVILVISHMVESQPVLLALRDEIGMAPVIAEYILEARLPADKYIKPLSVLNKITRGIQIDRAEAWVIKLLPHLVESLTCDSGLKNGSDATSSDCGISFCRLSILVNLCRNNPTVIHCLKTWTKFGSLLHFLSIKRGSLPEQLLCQELYLLIKVNGPVSQTLDKIFQVCIEGIASNQSHVVQIGADSLQSIGSLIPLHTDIISYSKYESACKGLIDAVKSASELPIEETAALLATLLRLDLEEMRTYYPTIMNWAGGWLKETSCCSSCLQLLHCLVALGDNNQVLSHINDFLVATKPLLSPALPLTLHSLSMMVDALHLVQNLVDRNPETFGPKVSLSFNQSFLSDVLNVLVEFNSHIQALGEMGSRSHLVTGYQLDNQVVNMFEGRRVGRSPYKTYNSSAGSLLCSEAILRLLGILKTLAKQETAFMKSYSKINHSSLMVHVVRCSRSPNKELVALSASLLRGASEDFMEAFIQCTLDANLSAPRHPLPSDSEPVDPLCPPSLASSGQSSVDSGLPIYDLNASVDQILGKLNGVAQLEEMKGHSLTEIVDVYEFKMASMQHTQMAMTEYLANADAKCKLMEKNLMFANVESSRFRQIIRSIHHKLESCQSEVKVKENTLETLSEEFRKTREQLTKDKIICEREATRLRAALNGVQNDLLGKQDELTKANFVNKENVGKLRHLERQMTTQKEKNEELSVELQNSKDSNEKSLKELESLQKVNALQEKKESELKKENNDMQKHINQLENSLMEKEKKIEDLVQTTESLQKIQDMIHNISKTNKA